MHYLYSCLPLCLPILQRPADDFCGCVSCCVNRLSPLFSRQGMCVSCKNICSCPVDPRIFGKWLTSLEGFGQKAGFFILMPTAQTASTPGNSLRAASTLRHSLSSSLYCSCLQICLGTAAALLRQICPSHLLSAIDACSLYCETIWQS